MNGFYKVKVNNYGEKPEEWSGVVVGNDEGDLMNKVMKYYGHDNVEQISFWFGEFYDNDVVEFDDFKDCPLFDFH